VRKFRRALGFWLVMLVTVVGVLAVTESPAAASFSQCAVSNQVCAWQNSNWGGGFTYLAQTPGCNVLYSPWRYTISSLYNGTNKTLFIFDNTSCSTGIFSNWAQLNPHMGTSNMGGFNDETGSYKLV